jgi:hypothetical protein
MAEHELPAHADGYRELARLAHRLSCLTKYTEVQHQLNLVALQYERLAECLERLAEFLPSPTPGRTGADES